MKIFIYIMVIVSYVGLASLSAWLFIIRPQKPVKERIDGLLKLIAVYTFLMGLCVKAGLFGSYEWLARDLTASDPVVFLAGNFYLFSIFGHTAGMALSPSASIGYIIKMPFLIFLSIILIAYTFIHLLVIVPITYFGYFITSIPIDAIPNSTQDVIVKANDVTINIKDLIKDNEVTIRNFAVGLPAFVISVMFKLVPLLRKRTDEV